MDSPNNPNKNYKKNCSIIDILFYILLIFIILFAINNLYNRNIFENFDNTQQPIADENKFVGSTSGDFIGGSSGIISSGIISSSGDLSTSGNVTNTPTVVVPSIPITGNISGVIKTDTEAESPDQIRDAIEKNKNTPVSGDENIVEINNSDDIDNIMVGGVFKLRVNIPMMPNYIKGEVFDDKKGKDKNYFYLCVQKMIPNCSLASDNNTCSDVYVDDPSKCKINVITSQLSNNPYRLVLVSEYYLNLKNIELGKNSDFTLVKIGDKYFLKNIQTGYMPTLFKNQKVKNIYGEINNNSNSNVAKSFQSIYNRTCKLDTKNNYIPDTPVVLSEEKILTLNKPGCEFNPDPTTYLITTSNINETSPIVIIPNKDKTISINIISYNFYAQPSNSYYLSKCDFNVKTLKGIGQVNNPDPIGPIYTNLVCINLNPESKLDFSVKMIKYP